MLHALLALKENNYMIKLIMKYVHSLTLNLRKIKADERSNPSEFFIVEILERNEIWMLSFLSLEYLKTNVSKSTYLKTI